MADVAAQAQAAGDPAPGGYANRMRWGPRVVARLVREPALAITLAYLFVGAVGLWSSVWYYRALGIPVLEYYQAGDFLVAGLRDPVNFLLLLLVIAVGLVSYSSSWYELRHPARVDAMRRRWWGRLWFNRFASPRRARRWFDLSPEGALVLATVFGGGTMLIEHATRRAEALRAGAGAPLRITLLGERLPLQGYARLAGTSGSHVFLYWPANGRSEALPVGAVGRIEHLPRVPARRAVVAPR